MKKDNKEVVKKAVEKMGCKLACYTDKINELSKKELQKVLESVKFGDSTDIRVFIRRKKFVVELFRVDNEIDLILLSENEYISRYGRSIDDEY